MSFDNIKSQTAARVQFKNCSPVGHLLLFTAKIAPIHKLAPDTEEILVIFLNSPASAKYFKTPRW
jgi:hypothetical protein